MVMATRSPQGARLNPQNTLEISQGMSIQNALNTAGAHGGLWAILVYPGIYDEGDLTPPATATVTIKGVGEGTVYIQPTAAPATAVINITDTLHLESITVIAPDATRPAVLVNTAAGVPSIRRCSIIGVGPGYSIQMTQGSLDAYQTGFSEDVHLSTARCVLDCYECNFFGDIITAAEVLDHDIDLINCDMTQGNITSNATGATVVVASHTGDIATVTNAGTGLFEFRDCYIDAVSATNAAGSIRLQGGTLNQITRAVGSVVWWLDDQTIRVLPCGTVTDTVITWALAAAATAGRRIDIRLAAGEYEEDSMACVDDAVITGCGHTSASGSYIRINSANAIFTCGAVQMTIRGCRIIQQGAGDCLNVTNAAGVLHLDEVVFGSAGQSAHLTAGTLSGHRVTVTAGNIQIDTAACTLHAHQWDINGNIVTGGAFAHDILLDDCDMNGNNITNGATGATTIEIWECSHIGTLSDASLAGTMLIEETVIVTATKTGTSPWTCRIVNIGTLSNNNAAGAVTCYGGTVLAWAGTTGTILWYMSTGEMRVLARGADDHINIQAALDALPATGGQVFLGEGTFQCEVSIDLDSYQTLRGCGRNTILTTSTADLVFLSAVGGAGTELTGIVIADLQIDGGAGAVSDVGIYFEYVDYSFIQNVYSRRHASGTGSYTRGIYLNNSDFNIITGNVCQGNSWCGIDLTNSSNNIVDGNTCQGNGQNDGIDVVSSTNNTITDNTCQGNSFEGIWLDSSSDNTITGNTCQGNGEDGIQLISSSSGNTITGNTCQGNDEDGIHLISSSSGNTITGNTCQGNGEDGIHLNSSCDNNTVTSNTCQGNDEHGIRLVSASNNTIVGNTLTENSQDTTNTYDDIYLEDSDYNNIQANTCRAGGLAKVPRNGINVFDAGCNGNLVTNNDIHNDGFGTGSFNDAGTGTVTVAGNRV